MILLQADMQGGMKEELRKSRDKVKAPRSYFNLGAPNRSEKVWSSDTVSRLKPAAAAREQAVYKSFWTVVSLTSIARSSSFLYIGSN